MHFGNVVGKALAMFNQERVLEVRKLSYFTAYNLTSLGRFSSWSCQQTVLRILHKTTYACTKECLPANGENTDVLLIAIVGDDSNVTAPLLFTGENHDETRHLPLGAARQADLSD